MNHIQPQHLPTQSSRQTPCTELHYSKPTPGALYVYGENHCEEVYTSCDDKPFLLAQPQLPSHQPSPPPHKGGTKGQSYSHTQEGRGKTAFRTLRQVEMLFHQAHPAMESDFTATQGHFMG